MRIALINYDELVVLGIATMVARYARDIELVDVRSRGDEPIDLVLLGPSGNVEADTDLLRRLQADPQVRRVAVLTGDFEPLTAETWLARGCTGYLSTSLASPELIDALRAITDGQRVLAPNPNDERPEGETWPGQEDGLTEREADVLSLVSGGLSNQEIADQLGLSVNSAKSYIRGAYPHHRRRQPDQGGLVGRYARPAYTHRGLPPPRRPVGQGPRPCRAARTWGSAAGLGAGARAHLERSALVSR